MKDELILNGLRVDLDSTTNITLNYRSNLFSDISQIVSNNSYTIKLPKTTRNNRIIDLADLPSHDSDFPGNKHNAVYLRNGVQITKNAYALLLAITDKIEIMLGWGNYSQFANMTNTGKTLQDLYDPESEYYVVWDDSKGLTDYRQDDFIFSRINFGVPVSPPDLYYHPSVRVKWILDKIQEDNNLVFDFPEDKQDMLKGFIIPLTTNEDTQEFMDNYPVEFKISRFKEGSNYSYTFDLELVNQDPTQDKYGRLREITDSIWGDKYIGYQVGYRSNSASVNAEIKTKLSGSIPQIQLTYVIMYLYNENGVVVSTLSIDLVNIEATEDGYIATYQGQIDVEIDEDMYLVFKFDAGVNVTLQEILSSEISLTLNPRGQVEYGEKYPIIANLPPIKQIDFIKAVCAMLGLFAVPYYPSDNRIRFISTDTLYENKPNARDWSKKLIQAYRDKRPREITFSLSGFAQNNIFNYKEDDTVTGNYSGSIYVFDRSIDPAKEMVTLPFAASDMKDDVAYIPIYSLDENGLQYSSVEPRILYEENEDGKSKGVFTGLDFYTLIEKYYYRYSAIVEKPKVIKENIRLEDIELNELDMSIPIYLSQYGSYFAIVRIKAFDSGTCDCELIKLNK